MRKKSEEMFFSPLLDIFLCRYWYSKQFAMPFIKIMIHFVWSTKNRAPFLNDEIRPEVFEHIKQNAIKKGIFIDTVNGYFEHIHCLISLSPDQTISKIIQLIKGESSFWINQQNLCNGKFEWQDEYFGASVSPSDIQKVRDYINNQEEHHRKKTFQQEYDDFLKLLGISS